MSMSKTHKDSYASSFQIQQGEERVTERYKWPDGGDFFAVTGKYGYSNGIKMREYFAGQAVVGLASIEGLTAEQTAECAYKIAEAMISVMHSYD